MLNKLANDFGTNMNWCIIKEKDQLSQSVLGFQSVEKIQAEEEKVHSLQASIINLKRFETISGDRCDEREARAFASGNHSGLSVLRRVAVCRSHASVEARLINIDDGLLLLYQLGHQELELIDSRLDSWLKFRLVHSFQSLPRNSQFLKLSTNCALRYLQIWKCQLELSLHFPLGQRWCRLQYRFEKN